MKNLINRAAILFLFFWIAGIIQTAPLQGATPDRLPETDTAQYRVYHGKVVNRLSNAPLVYAEVTVAGENTATVTNSQGEFVIKIRKKSRAKNIVISHLGYKSLVVPLSALKLRRNLFRLEPVAIALNQVYIHPDPAYLIVKRMLENISKNYPQHANRMTAFYREFIKKRNHYVSLAEAVVGVYKAPYKGLGNDQVSIIRGRKGNNVKRMDTLLFKMQGGPATGLLLDIVKNPYVLLHTGMLQRYTFKLVNETKKGKHVFYVIRFNPVNKTDIPRYSGTLYIDAGTYALASADFTLSMDDPQAAARLFIKKKPRGAVVTPAYAHYIVNYREQNGLWYFNYAKGETRFKVKWDKRLFSSTYDVSFEMAVTDRENRQVSRFKPSERFRRNQIFAETVEAFSDKNYWGKYNYIEPNQSIESAIRKFKRKLKK